MKKESVALNAVKFLITFLACCFLWLIIFSITLPPDETGATSEPFPGAICVCGIVTATVIAVVVTYNQMQKAYQKTKSSFSNIKIFEERTVRLLEKANKVADKYMTLEENVQIGVAEKRTPKSKIIRNAQQFQIELENYPELKANESIMELLSQIRDTENGYAQSKLDYNSRVEYYNSLIHSFPNNILRKMFKFKDAEFYNADKENEISDEELGI